MSNEQTVSGGVTRIEIGRAEGELEVLGWDESHIRLVGLDDEDSSEPQISEGILRLDHLEDDVTISVPRQASLHVLSAKDDLTVRGVQGSIRIDAASGDVQMQDTGSISLGAVSGDTHIEGSKGGVRLDALSGDLRAQHLDSLEITGNISGDLEVRDVLGEVSIKRGIHGDAKFQNVGRVTISTISGDCAIVHAGSAYIGNLSGDLSVQEIEGACHIGNGRGDVKVRRSGGMVSVDNLGGDFTGQDLRGGITTNNVQGDIHLDTPLVKDASYTVQASGDIILRIRGEIHARFVAQTLRGTIKTRLPLTVERGRRRHLVGALGRAETTVSLQSNGGDIVIEAVDAHLEDYMSDETTNDFAREEAATGPGTGGEFRFGRNFGVRWDKGPGRFAFSSSYGPDDPDGPGDPRIRRGGKGKFPFEWDDAQRAEYERRIREMSERASEYAERAAKRAAEYAERAAKRARETDWEAVGRDVRSSIERAMGEMEHLLDQFRTGPNAPRRPDAPPPPPPPGGPQSHARRVPIEQDEPAAPPNKDELDAQRRTILEKLRSGELSMDEAERQLDNLR